MLGYTAYLDSAADHMLVDPSLKPNVGTPPTFLIQAENDRSYINSSLAYYAALKDAGVRRKCTYTLPVAMDLECIQAACRKRTGPISLPHGCERAAF